MKPSEMTNDRPPSVGERAKRPSFGSIAVGLALLGTMALRSRISSAERPPPTTSHDRNRRQAGSQGHGNGEPDGHGREAVTPSEIPARGWKHIAWRVYAEADSDRVMLIAAGVTYYALLALFPAVAALVSLYGLFADPGTIKQQLSTLQGVLPQGAIEIIGDQITRIQGQGGGTLGFYFFVGLAVSLWSANAGMKSIFDALNVVYEEDEKRSFVQYNLQSLAFTLGSIVFIILAVSAIVVLPAVFAFIGFASMAGWVISLLRWPVLLVVVLFFLAVLYRFGPSREKAQWRWVTWGSAIAAVVWVIGSMLFSWYVSNFGTFNETYGSLGAVIGFMIWIWLSAIIVLVGAEINAEMEHQTRKDTTTGEPQPRGARGATMADRVAGQKS